MKRKTTKEILAESFRELAQTKNIDKITIQDINNIEQILKSEDILIAMSTVPAIEAQKTAEKLVEYGIKGILSYAPILLNLPDDIQVEYIDPVLSLQHITYYLK